MQTFHPFRMSKNIIILNILHSVKYYALLIYSIYFNVFNIHLHLIPIHRSILQYNPSGYTN